MSGLALLGVIALAGAAGDTEDESYGTVLAATGGVALGFGLSAWYGFGRANNCEAAQHAWQTRPRIATRPAPAPFAPFVEVVAARDAEAARLTREAHDAARAGNCAPTAAHGPRVNYLDRDYYDKVFLADDAIARCR